ncbi:MAG: hypothetical protein CML56_00455 [Rhodobacteraceae bacterium]|nr:hypothetical protein [Paracoccaceae bacterium]|tara:strand:+ start:616 stop:843 length:228 start_codon:yes stop_codon:yes gene_type:complete
MSDELKSFDRKDDRIVYVKSVDVDDLPDDIRVQLPDNKMLYAVHNASGQRLALVKERDMAFVLARQNDLSPVTVH